MLDSPASGMRREIADRSEYREFFHALPNQETAELVMTKIIESFEVEGYYVHAINTLDGRLYQIRKGTIFMTLQPVGLDIKFICQEGDMPLVHTVVYEALADIQSLMQRLKTLSSDWRVFGKQMLAAESASAVVHKRNDLLSKAVSPFSVRAALISRTKEGVLEELLDLLVQSGRLDAQKKVSTLDELIEREKTMSTGLQDGVALPHVKTDSTIHLVSAIGLIREGIEFDSLDGQPSRIFILTLAPKGPQEPYLEYVADVSRMLMNKDTRERILASEYDQQLYQNIVQPVL